MPDLYESLQEPSQEFTQALDQVPVQGPVQVRPDTRQKYIASVLTDKLEDTWDPLDFPTVRKKLYANTVESLKKRFPLYNDKYELGLENVEYIDPEDFSLKDQKRAIMEGKTLGRRIRGVWTLKDIATGKVIEKTKPMTLLKVPYLTERGTFIRNGSEYTFSNILRLQPGVYTRRKDQDEILAQFNAKQGTGTRIDMVFKPSTGVFQFRKGTLNVPAYTVLKDYGITDDQLKNAWGDELWKMNMNAASNQRARSAADKFYNDRG